MSDSVVDVSDLTGPLWTYGPTILGVVRQVSVQTVDPTLLNFRPESTLTTRPTDVYTGDTPNSKECCTTGDSSDWRVYQRGVRLFSTRRWVLLSLHRTEKYLPEFSLYHGEDETRHRDLSCSNGCTFPSPVERYILQSLQRRHKILEVSIYQY